MTAILVVEDEQVIREILCDNLEFDGFSPIPAANLAEADKQLKLSKPEMVLLDLNLPDGNGADRLKEWRKQGVRVPVIVCTIRDREIDIIKALDSGADDYVTKPFRIRELIARIKAVLRCSAGIEEQNRVKIGNLEVDFVARSVSCGDEAVNLTTTEWQILEYLWKNRHASPLRRGHPIFCRISHQFA